MEEIQKYDCLYNKFSKDYKNKYKKKINCWSKIGEKFGIDPAEADKKFKNVRTAYGRYLKKRKSVPSGSGRDAVQTPREFANLDWLATLIYHRASVSNLTGTDSSLNATDEVSKKEGEKRADVSEDDDVDDSEDGGSRIKADESSFRQDSSFSSDLPVGSEENSPERESNKSNRPNAAKPTPKRKSSRSWASMNKKPSKEDVDLVLIRTANSLVERMKQAPEPENAKRKLDEDEDEDEDSLFGRSLAQRMKRLPPPPRTKYYVRLQIEQMLYQV